MLDIVKDWLQSAQIWLWSSGQTGWHALNDYAYLRAAFIAAAGYLCARLLSRIIPNFISYLLRRFHLPHDGSVVNLSRGPLLYVIFLSSLLLAVKVSSLNAALSLVIGSILKSILILILALYLYQLTKRLLSRSAHSSNNGIVQPQTLPLFNNTALVFILVGALQQVFAIWNIDMTAILASAGIAGLAIGMASKDMLADFIAGILILTDAPFRINDYIELNDRARSHALKGRVIQIGMRSTRVLTKDNVEVIVPNSLIAKSQIINESSAEQSGLRIRVEITTAYGVDSNHIRELLLDVVKNSTEVLQDHQQVVQLLEFNRQCATFRVLCWIADPLKQNPISTRLREAIYQRLLAEEIPLALPAQQELHITQVADSRQEIAITDMPSQPRELYVKELPNLFTAGEAKSFHRIHSKIVDTTNAQGKESTA